MKKSILTIAAVVICAASLKAQEKTYKPEGGMSSLEVTFDPTAIFNANSYGSMFGLNSIGGLNQGIKYRNWMSENMAARGTFLFGLVNQSFAKTDFDSQGNEVDLVDNSFEWALQIRPGVERHFSGTSRLSPYVGSELIIGYGANKLTSERLDTADAVVSDVVKNDPNEPWRYANGFTIGFGLMAGFDYYVAKDLYLGLEINYAVAYNKANKITREVNGIEPVETKTGSNWYINPSSMANLKLGWNF